MRKIKILSGAFTIVFALQNAIFVHAAETSFWAERRRSMAPAVASAPLPFFAPSAGPLPSWLQRSIAPFASINNIQLSTDKTAKTILLFQDAHLHNEAQLNSAGAISAIAAELEKQKQTLLVGLEAAPERSIDLSMYAAYPQRQALHDKAEIFLNKHVINGAEFAAIGYGAERTGAITLPMNYIGVEKWADYEANVQAFREANAVKEKTTAALQVTQQELAAKKKKYFDDALARFDSQAISYEEGKLGISDYALYLDSVVPAMTLNAQGLVCAVLLEKSLDLAKVESQRTQLMQTLIHKLSSEDVSSLTNASSLLQSGHLSSSAFYGLLKNLTAKKGVSLARYTDMNLYIQYVVKSEAIDSTALLTEMRAWENTAGQKLAKTPEQRDLLTENRSYRLQKKLSAFELTQEEWKEYANRHSRESGNPGFKPFENFYTIALQRNNDMAANFAKRLESGNETYAVLVAGGFHAHGLKQELTKAGFNVVTVSPKITKSYDGPSSLDFLASNRTPLDQLFVGERLFLDLPRATAMDAKRLEASFLGESQPWTRALFTVRKNQWLENLALLVVGLDYGWEKMAAVLRKSQEFSGKEVDKFWRRVINSTRHSTELQPLLKQVSWSLTPKFWDIVLSLVERAPGTAVEKQTWGRLLANLPEGNEQNRQLVTDEMKTMLADYGLKTALQVKTYVQDTSHDLVGARLLDENKMLLYFSDEFLLDRVQYLREIKLIADEALVSEPRVARSFRHQFYAHEIVEVLFGLEKHRADIHKLLEEHNALGIYNRKYLDDETLKKKIQKIIYENREMFNEQGLEFAGIGTTSKEPIDNEHLNADELSSFRQKIVRLVKSGQPIDIRTLAASIPRTAQIPRLKKALIELANTGGEITDAILDDVSERYQLDEAEQVALALVVQPGQGKSSYMVEHPAQPHVINEVQERVIAIMIRNIENYLRGVRRSDVEMEMLGRLIRGHLAVLKGEATDELLGKYLRRGEGTLYINWAVKSLGTQSSFWSHLKKSDLENVLARAGVSDRSGDRKRYQEIINELFDSADLSLKETPSRSEILDNSISIFLLGLEYFTVRDIYELKVRNIKGLVKLTPGEFKRDSAQAIMKALDLLGLKLGMKEAAIEQWVGEVKTTPHPRIVNELHRRAMAIVEESIEAAPRSAEYERVGMLGKLLEDYTDTLNRTARSFTLSSGYRIGRYRNVAARALGEGAHFWEAIKKSDLLDLLKGPHHLHKKTVTQYRQFINELFTPKDVVPTQPTELLQTPILLLGINIYVLKRLYGLGVRNIGDLIALSPKKIRSKSLPLRHVIDVERALASYGLKLADEPKPSAEKPAEKFDPSSFVIWAGMGKFFIGAVAATLLMAAPAVAGDGTSTLILEPISILGFVVAFLGAFFFQVLMVSARQMDEGSWESPRVKLRLGLAAAVFLTAMAGIFAAYPPYGTLALFVGVVSAWYFYYARYKSLFSLSKFFHILALLFLPTKTKPNNEPDNSARENNPRSGAAKFPFVAGLVGVNVVMLLWAGYWMEILPTASPNNFPWPTFGLGVFVGVGIMSAIQALAFKHGSFSWRVRGKEITPTLYALAITVAAVTIINNVFSWPWLNMANFVAFCLMFIFAPAIISRKKEGLSFGLRPLFSLMLFSALLLTIVAWTPVPEFTLGAALVYPIFIMKRFRTKNMVILSPAFIFGLWARGYKWRNSEGRLRVISILHVGQAWIGILVGTLIPLMMIPSNMKSKHLLVYLAVLLIGSSTAMFGFNAKSKKSKSRTVPFRFGKHMLAGVAAMLLMAAPAVAGNGEGFSDGIDRIAVAIVAVVVVMAALARHFSAKRHVTLNEYTEQIISMEEALRQHQVKMQPTLVLETLDQPGSEALSRFKQAKQALAQRGDDVSDTQVNEIAQKFELSPAQKLRLALTINPKPQPNAPAQNFPIAPKTLGLALAALATMASFAVAGEVGDSAQPVFDAMNFFWVGTVLVILVALLFICTLFLILELKAQVKASIPQQKKIWQFKFEEEQKITTEEVPVSLEETLRRYVNTRAYKFNPSGINKINAQLHKDELSIFEVDISKLEKAAQPIASQIRHGRIVRLMLMGLTTSLLMVAPLMAGNGESTSVALWTIPVVTIILAAGIFAAYRYWPRQTREERLQQQGVLLRQIFSERWEAESSAQMRHDVLVFNPNDVAGDIVTAVEHPNLRMIVLAHPSHADNLLNALQNYALENRARALELLNLVRLDKGFSINERKALVIKIKKTEQNIYPKRAVSFLGLDDPWTPLLFDGYDGLWIKNLALLLNVLVTGVHDPRHIHRLIVEPLKGVPGQTKHAATHNPFWLELIERSKLYSDQLRQKIEEFRELILRPRSEFDLKAPEGLTDIVRELISRVLPNDPEKAEAHVRWIAELTLPQGSLKTKTLVTNEVEELMRQYGLRIKTSIINYQTSRYFVGAEYVDREGLEIYFSDQFLLFLVEDMEDILKVKYHSKDVLSVDEIRRSFRMQFYAHEIMEAVFARSNRRKDVHDLLVDVNLGIKDRQYMTDDEIKAQLVDLITTNPTLFNKRGLEFAGANVKEETPIAELQLSARALKGLQRLGITTPRELEGKTSEDLMKVKNVGVVVAGEILEKFNNYKAAVLPPIQKVPLNQRFAHPVSLKYAEQNGLVSAKAFSSTPAGDLKVPTLYVVKMSDLADAAKTAAFVQAARAQAAANSFIALPMTKKQFVSMAPTVDMKNLLFFASENEGQLDMTARVKYFIVQAGAAISKVVVLADPSETIVMERIENVLAEILYVIPVAVQVGNRIETYLLISKQA